MRILLKNLTEKELDELCSRHDCLRCPYKFMSVKIGGYTPTKGSYSFCLRNLYNFNNTYRVDMESGKIFHHDKEKKTND